MRGFLLAALAVLAPAVVATDIPGYMLYPSVDMRQFTSSLDNPPIGSFDTGQLNIQTPYYAGSSAGNAGNDLVKNLVTLDKKYNAFMGCGFARLMSYTTNVSWNSYLRLDNSSAPVAPSGGSLWRLENGALASPDKKFLSSGFTDLVAGNYYQLPDYLLAKTCDGLDNHECMGFVVAHDDSGGFLLRDQGNGCPKWFATPDHFNRS
jgi:hypothetical protein